MSSAADRDSREARTQRVTNTCAPAQRVCQLWNRATALYKGASSSVAFGMLLVLLSTLAFSSMALLVNRVKAFPSFQQVSIRFWVQALTTTVFQAVTVGPDRWTHATTWLGAPKNRRLLITRSLWGACGMSSYYYALTTINLSDATALVFTNVPMTAVFARVLLKEPYTLLDGATAVLSMAGVVLVSQPTWLFGGSSEQAVPWAAVLVCLFGAATSAMAYVTIRQIGKSESPLVVVLVFAAVGSVVGPCAMWLAGQPFVVSASGADVAGVLCMGFLGFVGQLLLNAGIQMAPAGPASVMRYADILFAIIFQVTLVGEAPGALKIVGALLIMSCVAAVYLKARAKDAKDAAAKRLAQAAVAHVVQDDSASAEAAIVAANAADHNARDVSAASAVATGSACAADMRSGSRSESPDTFVLLHSAAGIEVDHGLLSDPTTADVASGGARHDMIP